MTVQRITPATTRAEGIERLRAEYGAHMQRAQELYERALRAEEDGAPNSGRLMRQTIIEQNAALLCQGELNRASIGLTLSIMEDLLALGGHEEQPSPIGGVAQ